MPANRRARRLLPLVAALLTLAAGCMRLPQGDEVSQAQLLLDLGDALSELRGQDAMLQDQVDSLRGALARQDTLILRLAAATGVPTTP